MDEVVLYRLRLSRFNFLRKVAGKSKLELAQFAESQAFAQFASALDKTSQNQLARGRRLPELLKQSQSNPLPVGTHGC